MDIYYVLIVILTASAIFIGKYFNIILTIPLFLIGTVLLIASKLNLTKNNQILNIFTINIGFIFIFLSSIFTILNIYTFVKTPLRTSTKNIGEYKNFGKYINQSKQLGYTYKKNISINSTKIKEEKNKLETIYDVNYKTDNYGNRKLPQIIEEGKDSIVFLGCSHTFGEGLNDDQTLPYYLSKMSGLNSINTGMHGYGTHQALMLISDKELIKERFAGKKISHVIYRASTGHISRAAGYAPWDKFRGPCFEINKNSNEIEYRGNFKSCKNRSGFISKVYYFIFDRLSVANEPWTRNYFSRLHRKDFLRKDIKPQDEERFIAMIGEMKKKTEKLGSKFILLFDDTQLSPPCGRNDYALNLASKMSNKGIDIYLSSNSLNNSDCLKDKYHIKGDGHTSDFANKELANGIFNKYFKN